MGCAAGANAAATSSKSAAGSINRPGPDSGSAMAPTSGPASMMPRARNVAIFACVAGFSHMAGFIAGATMIGARVASSTHVARSSAKPCVIFASKSAEAGATSTRSGRRARRIWPISTSAAQRSSCTAWPVMAASASLVTKRAPPAVRIAVTEAPALRASRVNSSALYAETEPETISRILRPDSMGPSLTQKPRE